MVVAKGLDRIVRTRIIAPTKQSVRVIYPSCYGLKCRCVCRIKSTVALFKVLYQP